MIARSRLEDSWKFRKLGVNKGIITTIIIIIWKSEWIIINSWKLICFIWELLLTKYFLSTIK